MKYDLIVVGSGAAGMMAAITAAREGKKVLLLEKLKNLGVKLKATGGGRCNLTNTLEIDEFSSKFGREGRFMLPALQLLDHKELIKFFNDLDVPTHAPDGFRVFPTTHNALTILQALIDELHHLNVTIETSVKVDKLDYTTSDEEKFITGVSSTDKNYYAKSVIIATGGLGYPQLGSEGDGFKMAKELSHKIIEPAPAMMPLKVKESWVANCRADTIAKAQLRVNIKKYKKLKAEGDLIFTKDGIRGPVVLDFSRELTPLLKKYDEIPLEINLLKGKNEDEILKHFKELISQNREITTIEMLCTLLPEALSLEILKMSHADANTTFRQLEGKVRATLLKNLASTPLTVNGHEGFKMAMITRGGISLKEIKADTLESKLVNGLYFCGEVMNLDGPCGGYNLQFSFSSGYLAGKLLK